MKKRYVNLEVYTMFWTWLLESGKTKSKILIRVSVEVLVFISNELIISYKLRSISEFMLGGSGGALKILLGGPK